MTTHGKDIDKFWFSLFHELAHIQQPEEMTKKGEAEAGKYAKERLIPSMLYQAFLEKNVDTSQNIQHIAKGSDIALGMVVGREQDDGILKHHEKNLMILQGDL